MSTDDGGDIIAAVASAPEVGVDIRNPENRLELNSGSENPSEVPTMLGGYGAEMTKEEAIEDVAHNLTPKLLNTTRLLLGSRSFFFSYDWDITRTWSTRRHSAGVSLPLHKLVDPLVCFLSHALTVKIDKIRVISLTPMTVLLEQSPPETLHRVSARPPRPPPHARFRRPAPLLGHLDPHTTQAKCKLHIRRPQRHHPRNFFRNSPR